MIEPVRETGRLPPVDPEDVKRGVLKRLHPKAWLGAAQKLRDGAEIIIEHEQPVADILHKVAIGDLDPSHLQFPNYAPAYLLYAYAFENLLKGIIIAQRPDYRDPTKWSSTEEKQPRQPWMTHSMKALLGQADIKVSEADDRLLWLLEGQAKWSARYPVSNSVASAVRYDKGGLPDIFNIQFPKDHDAVRDIFRTLENELLRLMPAD